MAGPINACRKPLPAMLKAFGPQLVADQKVDWGRVVRFRQRLIAPAVLGQHSGAPGNTRGVTHHCDRLRPRMIALMANLRTEGLVLGEWRSPRAAPEVRLPQDTLPQRGGVADPTSRPKNGLKVVGPQLGRTCSKDLSLCRVLRACLSEVSIHSGC